MIRSTAPPHPAVLEALASPVRLDIVVMLESSPPVSVAEIGRRLGRRPDTLYHHVRALQRVRLIEPETRTSTGGRPGTVWRLKARPIRLPAPTRDSRYVHRTERIVGAIARASLRDFKRAARRAAAGEGTRPTASRSCLWLTPAERRGLGQALAQLTAGLRSRGPGEGRVPHVLTYVLAGATCATAERASRGRPRRRGARSSG